MEQARLLEMLKVPEGRVDAVLDTDAYNEIDDQFAISYMLRSDEKICVKAIYAAPFFNENSDSPQDGMEKSYQEIKKILKLAEHEELEGDVFRGSEGYLPDENTPVQSDAARDLVKRAMEYTPQRPLYVVAIGAITNVASALLINPEIKERIVIVWLGGNGLHCNDNLEFNLMQDVAAARVVFGCGAPVVQLPCQDIVEHFKITKPELEYWLKGRNPLSDYLAENTIQAAESYAAGKPWARTIWDVTAVAWLLNDGQRFMDERLEHSPIPEYDDHWAFDSRRHFIQYVYHINREALFEDLFTKLNR